MKFFIREINRDKGQTITKFFDGEKSCRINWIKILREYWLPSCEGGKFMGESFNEMANEWTTFWDHDKGLEFSLYSLDEYNDRSKEKLPKYVYTGKYKEEMKQHSFNIDEFNFGQIVFDNSGKEYKITDKSYNSIELYITKDTDKGINYTQWFEMRVFIKAFKINKK